MPQNTQPPSTKLDWRAEVYKVDPPPTEEVTYEFSNGRQFVELFHPTNGPYETEE